VVVDVPEAHPVPDPIEETVLRHAVVVTDVAPQRVVRVEVVTTRSAVVAMRRVAARLAQITPVSIARIRRATEVPGTSAALMRADVVARVVVVTIARVCVVAVHGAPLLGAVVRRGDAGSPERECGRRERADPRRTRANSR
jgi:hypothetical protein